MSHMCVDFTLLPSGKLMVSGLVAGRQFLTGVPSMMNIEVTPMSAIACAVAIVVVLRYCGVGAPNRWCAIAAISFHMAILPANIVTFFLQFDVTIVLSSSSISTMAFMGPRGAHCTASTSTAGRLAEQFLQLDLSRW